MPVATIHVFVHSLRLWKLRRVKAKQRRFRQIGSLLLDLYTYVSVCRSVSIMDITRWWKCAQRTPLLLASTPQGCGWNPGSAVLKLEASCRAPTSLRRGSQHAQSSHMVKGVELIRQDADLGGPSRVCRLGYVFRFQYKAWTSTEDMMGRRQAPRCLPASSSAQLRLGPATVGRTKRRTGLDSDHVQAFLDLRGLVIF